MKLLIITLLLAGCAEDAIKPDTHVTISANQKVDLESPKMMLTESEFAAGFPACYKVCDTEVKSVLVDFKQRLVACVCKINGEIPPRRNEIAPAEVHNGEAPKN